MRAAARAEQGRCLSKMPKSCWRNDGEHVLASAFAHMWILERNTWRRRTYINHTMANGCQLDCWFSTFHPTRTKGARSARHRCLASCLPPKTTTKSSQRACESCPTSVFAHAFVQLCEIFLLLPFSVQIQSVSNCATCLPKGDVTVTTVLK